MKEVSGVRKITIFVAPRPGGCPAAVLARRAEGETPTGQPARLVLSEVEGCPRYTLLPT
jgi:hypothetical protein